MHNSAQIAGYRGLTMSNVHLCQPCLYKVFARNCSRSLDAECSRISLSSSIPFDRRRPRTIAGTSNTRQLQVRSFDGRTSLAMAAGEPTTPCDTCNGRGWLLCDFCEGRKVNVQAKNSRIYRRCPSCRTAGVVICPRCKVFKCVSFPDDKDSGIAL